MDVEDDVTEIDIAIQDQDSAIEITINIGATLSSATMIQVTPIEAVTKSQPRMCSSSSAWTIRSYTGGHQFGDKATYQKPHLFGSSVDMQPVQWES